MGDEEGADWVKLPEERPHTVHIPAHMAGAPIYVLGANFTCDADVLHERAKALRGAWITGPVSEAMQAKDLLTLLVDITEQMSRMQLSGTEEWAKRDQEAGR